MTISEIAKKAKQYRKIQATIKQLEAEADTIKAEIVAHMDEQRVDTIQANIFTIRWMLISSSRVDTTALKRELPDIATRYTNTTESHRFQVV